MKTLIFLFLLNISFNLFAGLDSLFFVSNDGTFEAAIIKNKISLDEWRDQIYQEKIEFICLGESHKDEFRFFIAEEIVGKIRIDNLFLEADDDVAVEIIEDVNSGVERVELLAGSDIARVIRASIKKITKLE